MRKVVAVIRLIRPLNCLIMGIAVLVGVLVAVKGGSVNHPEVNLLVKAPLAFVTGFTFLAAANTINDYFDRDIDKINEPNRPIPSGAVTPSEALGYVAILSIVGFVAAFFTDTSILIIAVFAWLLLMFYAVLGKRVGIIGNFVVSACVSIPFIYGGFVAEAVVPLLSIFFASMAFFSTVGREVTKGIVDAHGDKLQNAKTVAVLWGDRKAVVVAVVFYVIAVILSVFPLLLNQVSFWYVPFVTLADIGFLFSSASLLRNYSRDNARRIKKQARIWMVIGLLAFIAGALG